MCHLHHYTNNAGVGILREEGGGGRYPRIPVAKGCGGREHPWGTRYIGRVTSPSSSEMSKMISSLPNTHTHSHTDQEERQWAIREFREGRKDVLVATDVASKGLDFPAIQHVINYDMPIDIENYGQL